VKKFLYAFAVLGILLGGYVGAAHFSGGSFPTPGLDVGGSRGLLRRTSLKFWEDIQFKDFKRAARYHSPELQETVDIPFLLQRLFFVKPEALDIMNYEVMFADMDTSGNRGRVKSRIKVKDLSRGEIRDQEVMLYYERADARAPFYMKLEDSLRNQEATSGKKN
jgi:hypothetical protein